MEVRINSLGRVKDPTKPTSRLKFLCGHPTDTGDKMFPPFAESVKGTNRASVVIWLPTEAIDDETGKTFDLAQMVIDGLAQTKKIGTAEFGAHLYLVGELFGYDQDAPFDNNGMFWQTTTIQLVKGVVPEFKFVMPVITAWKRGITPLPKVLVSA